MSEVSQVPGLKSLPLCWHPHGMIYDSELLFSKVFSSLLKSQCHVDN